MLGQQRLDPLQQLLAGEQVKERARVVLANMGKHVPVEGPQSAG
jgi:hypothetical protein